MKKRNGFVSNSSSASFVVYWRCLKHDEGENYRLTVEGAVDALVRWNEELKKYLKENTSETASPGTYETTGIEGFVLVGSKGAVKMVDRLEFSLNNFLYGRFQK